VRLYFSFCLRAYASALPLNVAGLVFWTVGMWLLLFFCCGLAGNSSHADGTRHLFCAVKFLCIYAIHTVWSYLIYPLHEGTQDASHTYPAFFPHTNSTVPCTVSASASDVALLKPPHKIN
jgi:hypothetical protein